MNHHSIFQFLIFSIICITFLNGRSVYYDQFNDDTNSKSLSQEEEGNKFSLDSHN